LEIEATEVIVQTKIELQNQKMQILVLKKVLEKKKIDTFICKTKKVITIIDLLLKKVIRHQV
jgi:hypothetical protein